MIHSRVAVVDNYFRAAASDDRPRHGPARARKADPLRARVVRREHPMSVPGVTAWWDETGSVSRTRRIVPDGRVDLIFDGARLCVAGPDTTVREFDPPAAVAHVALRMAAGTGAARRPGARVDRSPCEP